MLPNPKPNRKQEKRARRIRLVVVDDNPMFLRSLARLLARDSGLDIVGMFGNAREALDSAKMLHPDLILLDLRMPELNGYELIPRLRAELPNVKIVTMSLDGSQQIANATRDRGADVFILKEQMVSRLIPMIHELCGGSETTRSVERSDPKEATTMDEKEAQNNRDDWKNHTVEQLELTKKVIKKAQDNLAQAQDVIEDTQEAIRKQDDTD